MLKKAILAFFNSLRRGACPRLASQFVEKRVFQQTASPAWEFFYGLNVSRWTASPAPDALGAHVEARGAR
jgi:hypothetical protein